MKKLLNIFLLGVFCLSLSPVNAATTINMATVMKNRALSVEDKMKFADQIKKITVLRGSLKDVGAEVEDLKKTVNADSCNWGESKDRCTNRVNRARESLAAAQKEYDSTRKEIEKQESDYTAAYESTLQEIAKQQAYERKEIAATAKAVENAEALADAKKKNADNDMRAFEKLNWDIQNEFSKLRYASTGFLYDSAKFNSELTKMESTMDQSRLGAYMIGKMTKLMNSSAFCLAQNKCSKGGPDVEHKHLKDVFKNLEKAEPIYDSSQKHNKASK